MAFPNKNYTLCRGELYFGAFAPGTRVVAAGQEYIGNTTEINLTTETENLDHYDSDHGIRIKDDSIMLEKNTTGSYITDNITPSNLARMFLGASSVVSQASASAQAQTLNAVRKGRRYQLGISPTNPLGVRGVSGVTASAKPAGGSSTPLVANVDFRVDAETGAILFLSSGLILTNDPDDEVVVTFDVDVAQFNLIVSGSQGQLEGELFYKSYNPKGVLFDYWFPYVQLRPDGDFSLKGDDWQAMPFTFEALKRDDDTEVVYTSGRPGLALDIA